mmetsp:Transcript_40674/g.112973  ORF Transcript_40674/g.112973 Transcript_40674/m.112973 type:complete len:218 (+) Transcript_40674:1289-1942(+)
MSPMCRKRSYLASAISRKTLSSDSTVAHEATATRRDFCTVLAQVLMRPGSTNSDDGLSTSPYRYSVSGISPSTVMLCKPTSRCCMKWCVPNSCAGPSATRYLPGSPTWTRNWKDVGVTTAAHNQASAAVCDTHHVDMQMLMSAEATTRKVATVRCHCCFAVAITPLTHLGGAARFGVAPPCGPSTVAGGAPSAPRAWLPALPAADGACSPSCDIDWG